MSKHIKYIKSASTVYITDLTLKPKPDKKGKPKKKRGNKI